MTAEPTLLSLLWLCVYLHWSSVIPSRTHAFSFRSFNLIHSFFKKYRWARAGSCGYMCSVLVLGFLRRLRARNFNLFISEAFIIYTCPEPCYVYLLQQSVKFSAWWWIYSDHQVIIFATPNSKIDQYAYKRCVPAHDSDLRAAAQRPAMELPNKLLLTARDE